MATPAHLIIDGRQQGLPHAPGFYQAFPLEPSPLGDLSLSAKTTTVMVQNSSLDAAMDAMIRAGNGGVVVLVCHAFQGGLLLPIAPGGSNALAVVSNMALIDKMIAAEAEAARIRRLPDSTPKEHKVVIDSWTKLLNSLQPGAVTGDFTTDDAEKFYAKFLDMVAGKLELVVTTTPRAALQKFLAKVLQLRALRLARLELRACNIGKDKTSMEAVRKFFEAEKLTAPTVGTFYLSPVPVSTMAQFGQPPVRRRGVRGPARPPGPLGDRLGAVGILAQDGHTTRGFLKVTTIVPDFGNTGLRPTVHLGAIVSVPSFTLTIDEVKAFTFRASAAVASTGDGVTQDWRRVRAFVSGFVMPASSYQSGPFPLAGLNTPDIVDQPFVLPNETSYPKLFEKVP